MQSFPTGELLGTMADGKLKGMQHLHLQYIHRHRTVGNGRDMLSGFPSRFAPHSRSVKRLRIGDSRPSKQAQKALDSHHSGTA